MSQAEHTFPGDALIPDAPFVTTWSIEIGRPAGEVWPWLLQMGYGRGGWYIDTWWDKAINEYVWPVIVAPEHRAEHFASLHHLDDSLQPMQEGDIVPDGPPGSAWFTVAELQPQRALVLLSDRHIELMTPARLQDSSLATHGQFSWAFVLDSLPDARCRLTIRTRATMTPKTIAAIIVPVLKLVDRAFVKAMLDGIKRRVEGQAP